MAFREVRVIGDELLRKKSRVVENIDEKITELLDDMYETMEIEDGVGIAAPQVGVLKRVIIAMDNKTPLRLINPEILESSGEDIDVEGCLSVPKRRGKVKRPTYVKVRAQNEKGETIIIEAKGYLARILSHEIDHLDGILFVDRME